MKKILIELILTLVIIIPLGWLLMFNSKEYRKDLLKKGWKESQVDSILQKDNDGLMYYLLLAG